jgi:acetyl esterase/lipase
MALSPPPTRPPALIPSKTYVYKRVNNITLKIDIFLPPTPNIEPLPIMLFIHGGGWIGSNRTDYSRPLFHDFLSLNFVVCSMDYRLLPETTFTGLTEDVRDVEPWLRQVLPVEMKKEGVDVDGERLVVVGASAGAHLALLTVRHPQLLFSVS